jgi:hypothetical protein
MYIRQNVMRRNTVFVNNKGVIKIWYIMQRLEWQKQASTTVIINKTKKVYTQRNTKTKQKRDTRKGNESQTKEEKKEIIEEKTEKKKETEREREIITQRTKRRTNIRQEYFRSGGGEDAYGNFNYINVSLNPAYQINISYQFNSDTRPSKRNNWTYIVPQLQQYTYPAHT